MTVESNFASASARHRMELIVPCDDAFSMSELAYRITDSSNFRFAWQFYRFPGKAPVSAEDIRIALKTITEKRECHRFLERNFGGEFTIDPMHEHCKIEKESGEFENILARAADDHLGAYSLDTRDATPDEKARIARLFRQSGSYASFALVPGDVPGCRKCHDRLDYLFSNWFFGVAWDWTLFAAWPEAQLLWMGCLTDTD